MTIEDCRKELVRLYEQAQGNLYQSIAEVWLKMDRDIERRGEPYLNDLYRTTNYNRLLEHFAALCKELGGEEERIIEKSLIRAYEEAQEVIEQYAPQGALKTDFVIPKAMDVKQIVHQTWCLDGQEFSDRIWKNKRQLLKELTTALNDFASRGESAYDMERYLSKRLGVSEFCAYRIARTETAHAQVSGQVDKYKEMGFTHGIFKADDPCDECGSHDGERYTLDQIRGLIPKHPNCTCYFLLDTEV